MKKYILAASAIVLMASCGSSGSQGSSTPIDSTNVNGTAPAVYKNNNPADDTMSHQNVGDTGTKANNVHNSGTR